MIRKTITLPETFLDVIGKEYAGEYAVKSLSATEYLKIMEDLIEKKRFEAKQKDVKWNGDLPSTDVRYAIVVNSCTKDGNGLPETIPSKLFELLASVAVSLNTLNDDEQRELYKLFR